MNRENKIEIDIKGTKYLIDFSEKRLYDLNNNIVRSALGQLKKYIEQEGIESPKNQNNHTYIGLIKKHLGLKQSKIKQNNFLKTNKNGVKISRSITKLNNLEIKKDEDMIEVFDAFLENFSKRFDYNSILNLGEDALRYDFFDALTRKHNLKCYQVQLEHPIHNDAFGSKLHSNSKRPEKPRIDLYSPESRVPLSIEFGMFKRNSKLDSAIKKPANFFKMLNDMVRLSLNKEYVINKSRKTQEMASYFVCMADEKMYPYKMTNRSSKNFIFPDTQYNFSHVDLNEWIVDFKTAKEELDVKFVQKATEVSLTVKAELVYNQLITCATSLEHNQLDSRLIIYKVTSSAKIK